MNKFATGDVRLVTVLVLFAALALGGVEYLARSRFGAAPPRPLAG